MEEWADFRETGHAHAIGKCLLSQLDERARRDHLDRYPVQSLTPYTVRDNAGLLRRLERTGRMDPVTERQEYALGTVCAALPITAGATAATMAISLLSTRPIDCYRRHDNCKVRSADYWGHSRSLSASENSLLVISCAR